MTPTTFPRITHLLLQVGRAFNGLLPRRAGFFDEPLDTPLPHGTDTISLAEVDDARPDVSTLLARTPAAAPALIGVLAGWRTVTRTVRVPLLAGYVVSAVLPLERAAERSGQVGCTGRSMAQAGLAGGNGDPAALDLLASGAPAQLLDYF